MEAARSLFKAAADTGIGRLGELPPPHAILFFQALKAYEEGVDRALAYLVESWQEQDSGEADEVTLAC